MDNSQDYFQRFMRNIGIISEEEQRKLINTTVGIAGLGGLGGQTFINLVRTGIGKFIIADLDLFEKPNTNRQIGANENSYGKPKVLIMKEMAKGINPAVEIIEFNSGIQAENVSEFVNYCDVIVDSLDFFCLSARRLLYNTCATQKKTVILSAPLGYSATLHSFTPTSMSSDDFFNWKPGMDKFDQMIHFALGIAPSGLHLKYLNFDKKNLASSGTGPSISFSCGLGASLVAAEVLFYILKKRSLFEAPFYTQFDLFLGTYRRAKLRFGNRGLLQRLKIFLAKKHYADVRTQITMHIK